MPFDPKILHPDEPPLNARGELNLPDDLSALAEQLGEDAAYLAKCYSGEKYDPLTSRVNPIPKRQGLPARELVLAIAITMATAALFAVSLTYLLRQQRFDAQPSAALINAPQADPVSADEQNLLLNDQTTESSAGTVPGALSLNDLSGPELEAVLDLLEREPQGIASVAF